MDRGSGRFMAQALSHSIVGLFWEIPLKKKEPIGRYAGNKWYPDNAQG